MDYDGLILSIIQLFTQFWHNTDEIFFFSIVMYICMILCCSAENYMTINKYFLLSTKFFIYSACKFMHCFDTGVIAVLLSGSQGC